MPNLLSEFVPQIENRSPRDRPVQQTILDQIFRGLYESAVTALKTPGDAVAGKFHRAPETPGYWSDADEAMQQINNNLLATRGHDTALNLIGMGPGGVGAVLGSGSRNAAPVAQGIRAYHGSPHDFDRFDISKIGTGEGAQAYGHGLYFAENEGVARGYRDTLSKRLDSPEYWRGVSLPPEFTHADFTEWGALGQKMRKSNLTDQERARWRELTDKKRTFEGAIEANRPKGSMYEVNINADPAHFLDWDASLKGDAKETALKALTDRGIDKTLAKYIVDNKTGADVYSTLTRGGYDTRLMPSSEGMPAATQALREAGIPGIKYLDQGSRAAGDGSRNYVVFDDKLVDIVRKYGLAGLKMLPPGAAAYLSHKIKPVDYDPFGTPVEHDPFSPDRT